MSVGSALVGFFGLVWRILERIRKVLHLILMLVIFGFVLAALHTSIPIVPHAAALVIAPEGELVEQLSSDPCSDRPSQGHEKSPEKPNQDDVKGNCWNDQFCLLGNLGCAAQAG